VSNAERIAASPTVRIGTLAAAIAVSSRSLAPPLRAPALRRRSHNEDQRRLQFRPERRQSTHEDIGRIGAGRSRFDRQQNKHFPAHLIGRESVQRGGFHRSFNQRGVIQIDRGRFLDRERRLVRRNRLASRFKRKIEPGRIRSHAREIGRLKVVVVPGRLEPRAPELRGDIFGCDVESTRRSSSALERIGGEERHVGPERVRREPRCDDLLRLLRQRG
jgi:hypothetical protein